MPTRLLPPGYQVIDPNGRPVSGAQLYTYAAGTSTPKPTFSDAGLTSPNTNPVVADSAGRFGPIFADVGDYRIVMQTSTGASIFAADPVEGASGLATEPGAGIRNLLTGGDFSAVLDLNSPVSDGDDVADDWYVLTQSADITASVETLQADGIPANLLLTQSDPSAQRFGLAKVVPAADTYRWRGGDVTFSGRIRHSVAAPIRYAVLAWVGAADSPTRDVVTNWASASYTPGGFFIASDLVVLAVGAVTPTANLWTAMPPLTAAVPSAANNLILFVWTEQTAAQSATMAPTDQQLEPGASATSYEALPLWLKSIWPRLKLTDTAATFAVPIVYAPSDPLARWEKIADVAVTAVASIDALWSTGQYRAIEVILTGILPATVGDVNVHLMVRGRRSGSFLDGASAYNTQIVVQEGATVTGSTLDASGWFFSRGGFSSARDHLSGRFSIDPAGAGIEPGMIGQSKHSSASGPARRQEIMGGSIPVEGAIDGLRFLWAGGGNFAATGRIVVLGLRP